MATIMMAGGLAMRDMAGHIGRSFGSVEYW
jgi:hypothetical protein